MDLFIGLDVGTSAVKGMIVSSDGDQLARGKRLTPFLYPQPGFIEVEPEAHYRQVCDLIRELASYAPAGSRVRGIAMAAASGNTLLLDKNDRPLTNIINWMDERSRGIQPQGLDLKGIHQVVGWPWVQGGFPLGHLYWIKTNLPSVFTVAARYCMNTDWLLYRLCGKWGMDYSTATTFYLQDQVRRRWHKPYLEYLEIPEKSISVLDASGSRMAPLSTDGARDTGLSEETLVVLGAFDHPSAARGTGMINSGDLLLSCGTSWVTFNPLKERDLGLDLGLLIDLFLTPDGPWGVMESIPEIGTLIDVFIKRFVLKSGEDKARKYELFNERAAISPHGAEGLYVNPYLSSKNIPQPELERLAQSSPEQVARAVMEGSALRMHRNIERLAAAGINVERIAIVGGPTESPVWPQIVADIAGLELTLINGQMAGAVGAAILAAIGAGLYHNEREAFEAMGGEGTTISPDEQAVKLYDRVYEGYLERYEHD